MRVFDLKSASRGRATVPLILARIRAWRRPRDVVFLRILPIDPINRL